MLHSHIIILCAPKTLKKPIDFLASVDGSICKHLAPENNMALKRLFYLLGSQFSV